MTTHHPAHDRVTLGEKIDQPGARPTAKLLAVGGTGIATAVLLWAAAAAGLHLPEPAAEALVLAGAWIGGYIKRDKAVAAVVTRVEHALTPLAPLLPVAVAAAEQALPDVPAPPVTLGATRGEPEAVRGPQA